MKKIYSFVLCCTMLSLMSMDKNKKMCNQTRQVSSLPLQIPSAKKFASRTSSPRSSSPEFIQFSHSPSSASPLTGTYVLGQYILGNRSNDNSPTNVQ